ncbi:MAG: hypothetical protein QM278_06880 [Pseudomonadota bacterium]|nr:hypothetical protein [Pseudomonadota bacterium]
MLLFFAAYLALGLSIYRDYGISWDEPTHREIASVTAKYLAALFLPEVQIREFAHTPPLGEYGANQYGVVFDLPMYAADLLLGYNGSMAEAFYLRHLCTFLLFYGSVIFFYSIVRRRFASRALGLGACLFLILSPRIFADSFYGKDVVFLSLFIIAIYFFLRYLNRTTVVNALLFALATALVVDQRITGVFIPALAVFMTAIEFLDGSRRPQNPARLLGPLLVYLVATALFILLFWPYLWENPVGNFLASFSGMNRFPIVYPVLYLGRFIKSTEVPWHYIPLWILITTPLIYTFFFLLGAIRIVVNGVKNGRFLYGNEAEREDFLFLLLFLAPLTAVIVLNSALYDGWRHLYFLYAPFLLVAMTGAGWLKGLLTGPLSRRERHAAAFIVIVIVISLINTASWMIRHHPFQNVYFNILAGSHAGENFELDYWGLSFRRGLEFIVKNDPRPRIGLTANVPAPLINNAVFLDPRDLRRLKLVPQVEADYFLTNYRWHPGPYKLSNEVYSITVGGGKIFSVFKLR